MKKYYAIYKLDNKAICGTYIEGKDKLEAESNAGFKIMFAYPNVKYNNIEIKNTDLK